MGRVEIMRINGIPIYLDFFFILLIGLWSYPQWSSGSTTGLSAAFVLCLGVFASILLHELGHAWAGRWYGVDTRAIELNGLGGLCYFARSLPAGVMPATVVSLAGPFANLILWQLFDLAADWARGSGGGLLARVLSQLGYVNFLLLVFNLLPAFPLDGGKVLEAWLSPFVGNSWAVRVVAVLGILVGVWLILRFLPSPYTVLLGGLIAFNNWQMLQQVGTGFGRR
jgi:Zn-dependent protease